MKISIGSKIVEGPWGGGNLFAINMSKYLTSMGHEVIYNLYEEGIDLILLTDPRKRGISSSTFNHKDVFNYKRFVNPNTTVIQRVNECDQRKGTKNINKLFLNASKVSDHVIFVSAWLRDIYINLGLEKDKTSVVLAGADKDIFNSKGYNSWEPGKKLKIVTHHWSSNINKGFKEYLMVDSLISKPEWKNKIEFSYIGNLPTQNYFKNTNLVAPLSGLELAKEIKKNHVYITGSLNEPSGNHHIEAAQCGLPIIYKSSGGIPEYCNNFGIELSNDIEETINRMFAEYNNIQKNMQNYPLDSKKMCDEFYELFLKSMEINALKNKNYKSYFFKKNIFKFRHYLALKFWNTKYLSQVLKIILNIYEKRINEN